MKRRRIEVQQLLGVGDLFGESEEADLIEGVPLHKQCKKTAPCAETGLQAAEAIASLLRGHKVAEEQLLLRDLRADPLVRVERQFIELGLWRKTQRASQTLVDRVDRSMQAQRISREQVKQRDFTQLYLASAADWFAEDLEAIRRMQTSYDEQQMTMLADALRAGEDMFTPEEKQLILEDQEKE